MSAASPTYDVRNHDVVTHEAWTEARKALLVREKEFTRLRDQISQARRDLPWERVGKSYGFNGISPHLRARDIAFVAISRAPLEKLEAYRARMGWTFPWLSSYDTDFNRDFGVTFTDDEIDSGRAPYNYTVQAFPDNEAPGVSVFYKDAAGSIYHTYSSYGRGIDILNCAYNYIDLAPKGRDEGATTSRWVRRHDEY